MRTAVSAVLTVLTVAACGGRPSPGAITPSPELAALHDRVRVAGLDDRRFSPEAYWDVVLPVVAAGRQLREEEVGRSAQGRPLRMVTFGRGSRTVLLWSQMHGDESTASMALADIFALVASRPDDPVVRSILDELTVHAVPVLNPDGAARFQRRNAQGIDVNRDARSLVTPEGRTLKAVRDRVSPAFAFNLHDQGIGTRVGDSERGVAIALLAPPFDATGEVNAVRGRAIEVAGVIRSAIEPMVGDHIARYDDTFNPRAFGDLMTRWGASTILIESGGWDDDPQKQFLRRVNFVGILAALESIASGSHEGVSPELYGSLPGNGRRVGDLLVVGGEIAIPGLPVYRADLLINYADGLLETGGRIADIGDLAEMEARDTVSAEGLFLVPSESALDRDGGRVQLAPGAPADFVAARRSDGSDPVWVFQGRPPAAIRRER